MRRPQKPPLHRTLSSLVKPLPPPQSIGDRAGGGVGGGRDRLLTPARDWFQPPPTSEEIAESKARFLDYYTDADPFSSIRPRLTMIDESIVKRFDRRRAHDGVHRSSSVL
jgi:hypothetical protein